MASGFSLSDIGTGGGSGAKVGGTGGGRDDKIDLYGGACDVGDGDAVGGIMGCADPFVGVREAKTGVTGE